MECRQIHRRSTGPGADPQPVPPASGQWQHGARPRSRRERVAC